MPTLSQSSASPASRLAPLRRLPFWAQALALCAIFAIACVAVIDDYGIGTDEDAQREIAIVNADYIATGDISGLSQPKDIAFRYYGIAFEAPLLLAERALGLQDSRHIYLTRHLLTHLFFIAGGFACGMLAYRMIGSRWIALFAMLMFLLHPRLYAHSFFNGKDIPFAAMLAIALCLAHRAFRKDTLGAFLLCGIGAGLAINLRVFGLTLLPMILAMRAPDLWRARGKERKRVLIVGAAFLAAALGTAYISHPYYWENPLRFIEGILTLSRHPILVENLFMGEIYRSDAAPWNYIPVWFAITAPPVALALGAIGAAAVCLQIITRPLAALRDRELRFRILLLGCFIAPVAAVIALQPNIYNGWRHMYFLWAPFCLLAAVGLHHIANIRMGGGIWKVGVLLPEWARGGARLRMAQRALAYGIAGFGLLTTLTAMAALHPYEHVYFNALTDTKTPGALAKRYDMDYWYIAKRQSLEYLLARYPNDRLRVWMRNANRQVLPQNDRERILISKNAYLADYLIYPFSLRPDMRLPEELAIHSIRAYGGILAFTIDRGSAAYRDYYRAEYGDIEANGTLLASGDFDSYIHDGALRYLKENCEPPSANSNGNVNANIKVFLQFMPADRRERGFENRDFWTADPGGFFDGKCIHRQPLPDYPIARIATGAHMKGELVWRADIDFAVHLAAQAVHDRIAAGDYGAPVAQSDFDLYLSGNRLAYLKEPCPPPDVDARFFLHIFPADSADLPAVWREYGFENLDFQFADHGSYAGDKCVAERELPDYAIDRIRTGQFVSGEGRVWGVEFPVSR